MVISRENLESEAEFAELQFEHVIGETRSACVRSLWQLAKALR